LVTVPASCVLTESRNYSLIGIIEKGAAVFPASKQEREKEREREREREKEREPFAPQSFFPASMREGERARDRERTFAPLVLCE
jgi:hypothetical protein